MVGSGWYPNWAIRPGAFAALSDVVLDMPLFLALHSRNSDHWRPCYHNRDQLGATIGVASRTVTRQLERLVKVGLVFEVKRGADSKTRRNRPPARWALDPMNVAMWAPKLEAMLVLIAEEDGQGSGWLGWAQKERAKFQRRSERLALLLAEDMPIRKKPRRRRKRHNRHVERKLRPRRSFLAPGANLAHEGMVLPSPHARERKSLSDRANDRRSVVREGLQRLPLPLSPP